MQIVTSKKSNTVHFPYRGDGGGHTTLSVRPGVNRVDDKVWESVLEEMGSKYGYYGKLLTVEKEEKSRW